MHVSARLRGRVTPIRRLAISTSDAEGQIHCRLTSAIRNIGLFSSGLLIGGAIVYVATQGSRESAEADVVLVARLKAGGRMHETDWTGVKIGRPERVMMLQLRGNWVPPQDGLFKETHPTNAQLQ